MGDFTTRPDTAQSMVAASQFIYPDGKAHKAAAPSSHPPAASASQPRPPRRPQSPLFRRTSLQGGVKAAAGADQASQRRRPEVSAPAPQQLPQSARQQPERKAPRHQRPDAAAPASPAAIPLGDDEFRSSSDAHRSSLSGDSARGSRAGPSAADVRAEAFLQRFPNSAAADVLRKRMSESSGESAVFSAPQNQHQRQEQRRQPEPPIPQKARLQSASAAVAASSPHVPGVAGPGRAPRRGLPPPQPSASPPISAPGAEAADSQVWGAPPGNTPALSGASSGSPQFSAGALQASGGDRSPWSPAESATGAVHAAVGC